MKRMSPKPLTRRTMVMASAAGGVAAVSTACGLVERVTGVSGALATDTGTSSPRSVAGDERVLADGADLATFDPKEIVTVLPRDAIPAIMQPRFLTAEEAQRVYRPDEVILGLDLGGDTRAYSTVLLNAHEIANDIAGGIPVAVTW